MQILKELCSNVKIIRLFYKGVNKQIQMSGVQTNSKKRIVEKTYSWFDNDRRLCRNYELTFDSAEEMVKITTIKLLVNKI